MGVVVSPPARLVVVHSSRRCWHHRFGPPDYRARQHGHVPLGLAEPVVGLRSAVVVSTARCIKDSGERRNGAIEALGPVDPDGLDHGGGHPAASALAAWCSKPASSRSCCRALSPFWGHGRQSRPGPRPRQLLRGPAVRAGDRPTRPVPRPGPGSNPPGRRPRPREARGPAPRCFRSSREPHRETPTQQARPRLTEASGQFSWL